MNTQLLSEFSGTTKSSESDHVPLHVVGIHYLEATTTDLGCQVIVLNQGRPREDVPANHISFEDLEARLQQIPGMADEFVKARPWVAETLYPAQTNLRTLRLSRGLTQTNLAELIGTSQPHLARIERGQGDLMRETMRRLCDALEIDMNTLDQALQSRAASNQESQ